MLNMRIGYIVNVKKHPDADTLYVEEVDVGEDRNRTIVSGLVKHVPLEQVRKINWTGRTKGLNVLSYNS